MDPLQIAVFMRYPSADDNYASTAGRMRRSRIRKLRRRAVDVDQSA
jgi:hypothetical protein